MICKYISALILQGHVGFGRIKLSNEICKYNQGLLNRLKNIFLYLTLRFYLLYRSIAPDMIAIFALNLVIVVNVYGSIVSFIYSRILDSIFS